MVEIGLHGNYWKNLKEYYETEYDGLAPGKYATQYAQEMERGEADVLSTDDYYTPEAIEYWIEDTMDKIADDENPDIEYNNETINDFPNIEEYQGYEDQIAAYFLLRDLDDFVQELKKNNKDYVEEAIRLNWIDMLEQVPEISDLFIF